MAGGGRFPAGAPQTAPGVRRRLGSGAGCARAEGSLGEKKISAFWGKNRLTLIPEGLPELFVKRLGASPEEGSSWGRVWGWLEGL